MRRLPCRSLLLLLGCLGCSAAPGDGDPVTYHHDAAPLLQRYCADCHSPGGIAPFPLTDFAAASGHAGAIERAVRSGTMPPWLPSDAGLPLRYSRKMRPEDRELLLRWIDDGAQEGDAGVAPRTDIPAAERVEAPRPDLRLDAGASYLPPAGQSDDYRCFVIHDELTEDLYVQAGTVRPDQTRMVHHAIVFEIPTRGVPKVRAQEGQDGLPGYKCFGGAGAAEDARVILAWAPGSVPVRFPEGTALKVSAGSLILLQVHYNLLNSTGAADRSGAELEVSREPPARVAQVWPLADPAHLRIAAGDPHARQVFSLDVWILEAFFGLRHGDILAYGTAPHMHLLGKRIVTSVQDGPVLLEVPRWDFHWQQPYAFQAPYLLRPQDSIRVECEYDNSPENQPVIGGQRQPPRDLTWGEGTMDEMCLSFLYVAPTGP